MTAAVNLYSDKATWQAAQQHVKTHLEHQFDRSILSVALVEKINAAQQQLVQHRLNNFTGAMLKHQTMGSTRYMSQWIMEKNKNQESERDSK